MVRFTWLMFVLISACTLTSLPECHIRSIDLVHLDHFLVKLKDVYLMLKRHLCLYLNFRAMTGIAEIQIERNMLQVIVGDLSPKM